MINKNVFSALILARGNEMLGDEGVAIKVARTLRQKYEAEIDIDEIPQLNFSLLDVMTEYDKVLLLDTISTGDYRVGTIVPFSPEQYTSQLSRSPHYVGLPDLMLIAKRLELQSPSEIRILAIEVENPQRLSRALSETIERSVPEFVSASEEILREWIHQ